MRPPIHFVPRDVGDARWGRTFAKGLNELSSGSTRQPNDLVAMSEFARIMTSMVDWSSRGTSALACCHLLFELALLYPSVVLRAWQALPVP
jgi:hypothetical protein